MLISGLLTGGLSVVAVAQAPIAAAAAADTADTAAVQSAAADPCGAGSNPIVCENSKPGTPDDVWDISGAGDSTIQGFTTDMSVNVGSTESFKIKSAGPYKMDIYRLGYYQGDGARLITSLTPTQRTQPNCIPDATTHLLDCGNWAISASWAVPSTAISGVYIVLLTRTDTGGQSHIPFVVRNDASTSQILMQTSDTTWQAYNNYGAETYFDGGDNFYGGTSYDSANRAYKLSYNRPFVTRGWEGGRDYLFSNEYPMIRFLESNGYDISYSSGVDTSRHGNLLKQHKVFLTAGHDEYWDTVQRANVEAARDAGVSLAFFSGNDDYWKTRWENSTDGTSTPYRTLVTYKETWANGKIDPSSLWTGTWRDPRFTPPADGDQPENALGGTAFMSNATDLPITVNSTEGKLRIWRNTSLASLAAGASAALAPHTVGYESNEDLDNGFRPAGLIDMSTSTGASASYLQDFGTVTAAGTTTHHITLYKAPSGALVFSAGTIQWAWGLDDNHDGTRSPVDPRMQQATVNLLADMGAQPTTLISGLVAASKSTDTTAPTSSITSPVSGATIANGTALTVSGTASDVGGVVGGVEVSVDGGTTWHPAVGRSSWTYSFVAHGSGQVAIKSRATDDSGNIETPGAGSTVTENCPCSLFGNAIPATPDAGDTSDVELGVKLTPSADGFITGIRFYKAAANTGSHIGILWSATGTPLATGSFLGESASGWQTMTFATAVAVTKGTTYVASYEAPKGHYSADSYVFSTRAWSAGPLTALRSIGTTGNGVYSNGGQFPTSTYQDENYYVDAIFTTVDSTPPAVSSSAPRPAQTGVATNSTVTAVFSTPITTGSAQATVKTAGGTTVSGATSYDSASRTLTFTPSAALATSTSYTVTISGATSTSGATMSSFSWSFTTDSSANCPCSLFGSTSTPVAADSGDGSTVELGVKFSPKVSGTITGIRFYKSAANVGTHTGTLWSSTGTALSTGTFGAETASGWQTLNLTSPVPVAAGSTYTASYLAPNGHYAADPNFFTTSYTSGNLTALAGANGVYAYGSGGVMPSNSFGSTNYWVDPLFISGNVAPTVVSTTPANGATAVSLGSTVAATFSIALSPGTAQLTVTGPGTTAVAGAVSLSSDGTTVTFTPSAPLVLGTSYTATVSGAKSAAGVAMSAPVSWSFSTSAPTTCPCTLFGSTTPAVADSGDSSSVELGVRFTPSLAGYVTGVKFYKSAANTGTHTATLWSATGTALGTGTFVSETTSGWQTLTFDTPIPVQAGSTYTASYLAPTGHYAATSNFFSSTYSSGPLVAPGTNNGVYAYGSGNTPPTNTYTASNYWVDVVFNTVATIEPRVTATTPVNGATGVSVAASPTATFAAAIDPATVVASVTPAGGSPLSVTTSYNAAAKTVTVNPAAALSASTGYTVTLKASDTAGNPMSAPASWQFTTAGSSACPCTLFGTTAPASADSGDTDSVELGVRFTPSVSGTISAVKFYKSAANTGTHTGTLWSASGATLATGAFTGETASGWQTMTFASPVAVTAGTTYTASYLAPNGHYAATGNFFSSAFTSGPLVVPGTNNGVYAYGSGNTPPTSTYAASNYWVDVVFNGASGGGTGTGGGTSDTTAPVITAVTATGTGSTSASVTWTTDEAATSSVAYGTSATALTSSATATGSLTSHAVNLTGLTANTRYYYRVTSLDPSANSATSPDTGSAAAQYAPTATPVLQTTAADFTAGTQSSTYVSSRAGGEVTLAPTLTQEFTGSTVPTGWTSTSLGAGSAVTVANGLATVSGRLFRTTATYTISRDLDVVGTLKPVSGQWLGATDGGFTGSSTHWVAFRTTPTGGLVAETDNGTLGTTTTPLASTYLGAAHRFEADWTGTTAVFSIDGTVVASQARGVNASLYLAAQDSTVDASPLVVDSLWLSPYATTGTFTSAVVDAGASVDWRLFTPTAAVPSGTTVSYQVRTGPNATAGGTGWSAFAAIAAGADIPGTARYLQYRATLTTSSPRDIAPTLSAVQLGYAVP